MSQAVPSVPRGDVVARRARRSGDMPPGPEAIGVNTGPGAMQLTRTPSFAWSIAIACVRPMTAALEVEYGVSPRGRRALSDEILMIEPPSPDAIIAGMANFDIHIMLLTLTV